MMLSDGSNSLPDEQRFTVVMVRDVSNSEGNYPNGKRTALPSKS